MQRNQLRMSQLLAQSMTNPVAEPHPRDVRNHIYNTNNNTTNNDEGEF